MEVHYPILVIASDLRVVLKTFRIAYIVVS